MDPEEEVTEPDVVVGDNVDEAPEVETGDTVVTVVNEADDKEDDDQPVLLQHERRITELETALLALTEGLDALNERTAIAEANAETAVDTAVDAFVQGAAAEEEVEEDEEPPSAKRHPMFRSFNELLGRE